MKRKLEEIKLIGQKVCGRMPCRNLLLILWGILLVLVVHNQRTDLDYIQTERWYPLVSADYQYSETGSAKNQIEKFRVDNGDSSTLFGYSSPEIFTSLLEFTFSESQTIKFSSLFNPTENCHSVTPAAGIGLNVAVNGKAQSIPVSARNLSELRIQASPGDQISINAEAAQSESACGAVKTIMTRLEAGEFIHFLLIWGIWLLGIVVMLINRNYFLPLLSIIIFVTLQKAEMLHSPILFWEQLLVFSALSTGSVLAYSQIISSGGRSALSRVLSVVLALAVLVAVLILPVVQLGFSAMFDGPMSNYDWFAVLQTNLHEVVEFAQVFAPKAFVLYAGLVLVTVLMMTHFSRKSRSVYPVLQWLIIVISAGFVFTNYSYSSVLDGSTKAITEYYQDLAQLQSQSSKRSEQVVINHANKAEGDEVYVVVIGESANRNHFSLYGYPRTTTPLLDERHRRQDLVRFNQAYSCGVSTRGALRFALTQATLKNGSPTTSPSIMEVLNAAELDTYWIHNGSTTIRNSIVSLIGEQATYTDHLSTIYGTEDGKLIAEVDKVLDHPSSSSKAIFLKTQGSHVEYCQRLPDGETWLFEDKLFDQWLIPEKYELTRVSAASNCYDGSIKYTDYVVDEVIRRVEERGKIGAVIYFADHGEEIVEGTAHMGSPTYGVFSIPMAIWFSNAYKERYKDKFSIIAENSSKVFVNDVLFDSLLGLMNVEYDGKTDQSDISSRQYQQGEYIFRGKKTVYDADNYIYYTQQNLNTIKQKELPFEVFFGPVEHPFHLAWLSRYHGRENIAIAGAFRDGKYTLDSSLHSSTPVALETVIKYLELDSSQRILLQIDLPPDQEGNINGAVQALIKLLEPYNLATEQLIITANSPAYLDEFASRGFSVSRFMDGANDHYDNDIHRTVKIELDKGLSGLKAGTDFPIDLWISFCNINNCSEKVFNKLSELSKSVGIKRVVIPMFEL